MLKGTISLMDRIGVVVGFEINGDNPKHFNINKIKKQKEMGAYGYTPVEIPAGGIVLPIDNHENFDWNSIGAKQGKRRMVSPDGEASEVDCVWFRGQMYTRRDWIGKKEKGAKLDDAIVYSRGARAADDDSDKVAGDNGGVGGGYIILIAFRKMKNMPEGFRYPEWDIDDEETHVETYQSRQANYGKMKEPERKSYIELKNLVASKLKAVGKDGNDEDAIKRNILARAKKVLNKEVTEVFKLTPSDNYQLFVAFGGTADAPAPEVAKGDEPKTAPAPAPKAAAPAQKAPVSTPAKPAPTQTAPQPAKAPPAPVQAKAAPAPAPKPAPAPAPKPAPKPAPAPIEDDLDLDALLDNADESIRANNNEDTDDNLIEDEIAKGFKNYNPADQVDDDDFSDLDTEEQEELVPSAEETEQDEPEVAVVEDDDDDLLI